MVKIFMVRMVLVTLLVYGLLGCDSSSHDQFKESELLYSCMCDTLKASYTLNQLKKNLSKSDPSLANREGVLLSNHCYLAMTQHRNRLVRKLIDIDDSVKILNAGALTQQSSEESQLLGYEKGSEYEIHIRMPAARKLVKECRGQLRLDDISACTTSSSSQHSRAIHSVWKYEDTPGMFSPGPALSSMMHDQISLIRNDFVQWLSYLEFYDRPLDEIDRYQQYWRIGGTSRCYNTQDYLSMVIFTSGSPESSLGAIFIVYQQDEEVDNNHPMDVSMLGKITVDGMDTEFTGGNYKELTSLAANQDGDLFLLTSAKNGYSISEVYHENEGGTNENIELRSILHVPLLDSEGLRVRLGFHYEDGLILDREEMIVVASTVGESEGLDAIRMWRFPKDLTDFNKSDVDYQLTSEVVITEHLPFIPGGKKNLKLLDLEIQESNLFLSTFQESTSSVHVFRYDLTSDDGAASELLVWKLSDTLRDGFLNANFDMFRSTSSDAGSSLWLGAYDHQKSSFQLRVSGNKGASWHAFSMD